MRKRKICVLRDLMFQMSRLIFRPEKITELQMHPSIACVIVHPCLEIDVYPS